MFGHKYVLVSLRISLFTGRRHTMRKSLYKASARSEAVDAMSTASFCSSMSWDVARTNGTRFDILVIILIRFELASNHFISHYEERGFLVVVGATHHKLEDLLGANKSLAYAEKV